MNLELIGKLHRKYDAQTVSEKFTKREFVVELADEINGSTFYNYAAMQLINAKCAMLDQFKEGDMVKVSFNIKGKLWIDKKDGKEKERYFSNLDAWRIELYNGAAAGSGSNMNQGYSNSGNQGNPYQGNQQAFSSNVGGPGSASESSDYLPF